MDKNIKEKVIYGENKNYGVIVNYTKVRLPYENKEEEKTIFEPFIIIDGLKNIFPIYCKADSMDKEKMMEFAKKSYEKMERNKLITNVNYGAEGITTMVRVPYQKKSKIKKRYIPIVWDSEGKKTILKKEGENIKFETKEQAINFAKKYKEISIGDLVKYKKYHLKNELIGEVVEIVTIEDSKEKDYIGQRIYTVLNSNISLGIENQEKVLLEEIKAVYKKQ